LVLCVSDELPIRPAATVILMRDGAAGLEVFLVQRHHAAAFMGGAHVFPGGRVDPSDYDCTPAWCDGMDAVRHKMPGVATDIAAAFCVAGLRELFEEAGVLLARSAHSEARPGELVSLIDAGEQERFRRHRHDVHALRRTFHSVLEAERLRLALDALTPFAHWVTPPGDTRRFDTRFFAARMPARQSPVHDETEATHGAWMTPREALASARRGDVILPPPTWVTLRELEPFPDVTDALAWASARPVGRRAPKVLEQNGARILVLPGDPLHPEPAPPGCETRLVWTSDRW